MSRAVAARLLALITDEMPRTPKQISIDAKTEISNVREWLYAFEEAKLVTRVYKVMPEGRHLGRSSEYWQWNAKGKE
jgi:hypothetical protein